MNYYAEITHQHYPGNDLWAPTNPKIWHWNLLTELSEGDVIFHFYTKQIPAKIIGKSIVQKKYDLRDISNDSRYAKKYKKVFFVQLKDYIEFKEPIVLNENVRKKIKEIGSIKYSPFQEDGHLKQAYLTRLDKKYVDFLEKYLSTKVISYPDKKEENRIQIIELLDKKKQVILYGPPGTGKTFKTKEFALRFLRRGKS